MASLGDLVVKITGDLTQFNKSINDAEAKMKATVGNFEKAGKSLTMFVTLPIVALGTAFVKMADDAEKSEASLRNAINATGNSANVNVESIKAFALEMQNMSRYEDDAVISAVALLEQLTGLNEDGLKKATPGILNFATAMGMDLQSAATAIGKTIGSDTNALSRYGIEVDSSKSKSEKLAQVTAELEKKFGGAAKAAGEAGVGGLVKLKNEAGNLAEDMGKILIPEVLKVVGIVRDMVKAFSETSPETKKTILVIAGLAAAIGPLLIGFSKMATAVSVLGTAIKAAGTSAFLGPTGWIALIAAAALGVGLFIKQTNDAAKRLAELRADPTKFGVDELENQLKRDKKALEGLTIAREKDMAVAKRSGATAADLKMTSELYDLDIELSKKNIAGLEKELKVRAEKQAALDAELEAIRKLGGEQTVVNSKLVETLLKEKELAEIREKEAADQAEFMEKQAKANADAAAADLAEGEAIAKANDEKNAKFLADLDKAKERGLQQKKELKDAELKAIDETDAAKAKSDADEKAANKEKIDTTIAIFGTAVKLIKDLQKAMAGDIKDTWDDATVAILEATAQISESTKTEVGLIVAGIAGAAGTVISVISSIIDEVERQAKAYQTTINTISVEILNTKIKALKDALKAELDAIDEAERAALEAADLQDKTAKELADEKVAQAQRALAGILEAIDAEKKAVTDLERTTISAIDAEEQAKLFSLGLVGPATLEQFDAAIAAAEESAKAALQAERDKLAIQLEYDEKRRLAQEAADAEIARIENQQALDDAIAAQKKAEIEAEYEEKRRVAQEAADKAERKLIYDRAIWERTIMLAQLQIDREKAIADLGWFASEAKKAAVRALYGELETAITSIPLPQLAEGGMVMPRAGGVPALLAEAGSPELVLPLDKLDNFFSRFPQFGSEGGGMMQLVVNMDSKPILSKIFPATRNGTVLIDARAVV